MWSKDHAVCVVCGLADSPPEAKGKCRRCYMKEYREKHAAKIAAHKKAWYLENVAGTDRQRIARETRNFDGQRQAVLERDGFKCKTCGATERLVVHHKDGSGRGSKEHNNDITNLVTLCRKCHADEHRKELLAAREAKKKPHCKRGHPRTPENGRFNGKQWVCRICLNLRARQYGNAKRLKAKID